MNQSEDESIVDIVNGIEDLADAGSVKIFGDIDGQVFQLIPCSREMFGFKVIVQAARDGTTVESAEVAMKGSATCDLKAIKRVAVALRRSKKLKNRARSHQNEEA